MKRLLIGLFLFSLGKIALLAEPGPDLVQATIVVYNRKAADSITLAYFYAKARQIPFDHLVGLECSTEEEISRQEYDQTIAEPLRKVFRERNWWTLPPGADDHTTIRANKIHFVALI